MDYFLGLGAQRTATTWLFECLRSHPEIFMPDEKELQFLSAIEKENNTHQGDDWYWSKLHPPNGQKISGEITPEYLLDPETPKRIKEIFSQPKLIVCLREPVSRAISAYQKGIRENNWDCSLEYFLKHNLDFCLDRGMYFVQIQRYLTYFPFNQLCIKIYDDIFSDSQEFIRSIYEFLGVDTDYHSPMLDYRFNIGAKKQSQEVKTIVYLRDFLYRFFGDKGRNMIVKSLQRTKWGNLWMQNLLGLDESGESQLIEYKNRFEEYFKEDIIKTGQLLNRDLVALWDYSR
jgi:hypothetical protein